MNPEDFLGPIPARTEITVLGADDPGIKPLGWVMHEYISAADREELDVSRAGIPIADLTEKIADTTLRVCLRKDSDVIVIKTSVWNGINIVSSVVQIVNGHIFFYSGKSKSEKSLLFKRMPRMEWININEAHKLDVGELFCLKVLEALLGEPANKEKSKILIKQKFEEHRKNPFWNEFLEEAKRDAIVARVMLT